MMRKRSEGAMLLVFKREGEAISRGMQAASRSWKRSHSPLEAAEGASPADTLTFAQ